MDAGGLVYDKVTWTLKQFHFHTPSEHRINGEHFPMEMHLVHQGPGITSILG
jgi:carbonic anhydrase